MGRYKRNKVKIRKAKRFVNVKIVVDFIKSNYTNIMMIPNKVLQVERNIVNEENSSGVEYEIYFKDKTAVRVGDVLDYNEESEEWFEAKYCIDYHKGFGNNIHPREVLEKLEAVVL